MNVRQHSAATATACEPSISATTEISRIYSGDGAICCISRYFAISQVKKCGLQYSYTERLYTLGLNRNATIHNEPLNRQKGTEWEAAAVIADTVWARPLRRDPGFPGGERTLFGVTNACKLTCDCRTVTRGTGGMLLAMDPPSALCR